MNEPNKYLSYLMGISLSSLKPEVRPPIADFTSNSTQYENFTKKSFIFNKNKRKMSKLSRRRNR